MISPTPGNVDATLVKLIETKLGPGVSPTAAQIEEAVEAGRTYLRGAGFLTTDSVEATSRANEFLLSAFRATRRATFAEAAPGTRFVESLLGIDGKTVRDRCWSGLKAILRLVDDPARVRDAAERTYAPDERERLIAEYRAMRAKAGEALRYSHGSARPLEKAPGQLSVEIARAVDQSRTANELVRRLSAVTKAEMNGPLGPFALLVVPYAALAILPLQALGLWKRGTTPPFVSEDYLARFAKLLKDGAANHDLKTTMAALLLQWHADLPQRTEVLPGVDKLLGQARLALGRADDGVRQRAVAVASLYWLLLGTGDDPYVATMAAEAFTRLPESDRRALGPAMLPLVFANVESRVRLDAPTAAKLYGALSEDPDGSRLAYIHAAVGDVDYSRRFLARARSKLEKRTVPKELLEGVIDSLRGLDDRAHAFAVGAYRDKFFELTPHDRTRLDMPADLRSRLYDAFEPRPANRKP